MLRFLNRFSKVPTPLRELAQAAKKEKPLSAEQQASFIKGASHLLDAIESYDWNSDLRTDMVLTAAGLSAQQKVLLLLTAFEKRGNPISSEDFSDGVGRVLLRVLSKAPSLADPHPFGTADGLHRLHISNVGRDWAIRGHSAYTSIGPEGIRPAMKDPSPAWTRWEELDLFSLKAIRDSLHDAAQSRSLPKHTEDPVAVELFLTNLTACEREALESLLAITARVDEIYAQRAKTEKLPTEVALRKALSELAADSAAAVGYINVQARALRITLDP